MVKRYDLETNEKTDDEEMVERKYGDWVSFEDFEDMRINLLEALKDLAGESTETFSHWPDLKAQTDAAIAKAR